MAVVRFSWGLPVRPPPRLPGSGRDQVTGPSRKRRPVRGATSRGVRGPRRRPALRPPCRVQGGRLCFSARAVGGRAYAGSHQSVVARWRLLRRNRSAPSRPPGDGAPVRWEALWPACSARSPARGARRAAARLGWTVGIRAGRRRRSERWRSGRGGGRLGARSDCRCRQSDASAQVRITFVAPRKRQGFSVDGPALHRSVPLTCTFPGAGKATPPQ